MTFNVKAAQQVNKNISMKIHEYQAKQILAKYGIPIPRGLVATTSEEARHATESLGGRAVLKVQIHAGGRGKAGGIKVVHSPEEAEQVARSLLGRNLVTHQSGPHGLPINAVLVEELTDIVKEIYLATIIDQNFQGPVMIASSSGGIDIEEIASKNPKDIYTEFIEPVTGFLPFQARRLTARLKLDLPQAQSASKVMNALYKAFIENDCTLAEINPLIITGNGQMMALDAKIDLEDESSFRHPDLIGLRDRAQWDKLEAEAADLGISYVNLNGNVGCIVNGAGLAMATLDLANAAGAIPANFLDVGGGANEQKVASAFKIILSDPKVDRVLVNIFGGILRCDIAARGIVLACKQNTSRLPIVARMLGTNMEEGKRILKDSGLDVTFADTLAEAAKAIHHIPNNATTQGKPAKPNSL